jgi:Cholesterol oxidase, substrate-binding/FAD binding domain
MSNLSAPNGFPSDIPVAQKAFENWCQMITVPDVWTCTPRSEDDVVRVCNWAAGAGYKVRARGIMHGWSPLTVTDADGTNVMLVDMTSLKKIKSIKPATGSQPAQVVVQAGATMDALMNVLEYSPGGAPGLGFGFPHIPAPGHITVGGALAINAHGTAVPTPPNDAFPSPYGTLSNQVLAFTAVVTLPGSDVYVAHTFTREDTDAKAFLTHCGRAILLDVTLQVVANYNLRCQSRFDVPSSTLFARPRGNTPPPGSVGDYLDKSGRIEVIWFPSFPDHPPTYPWLKVWTVSPRKPAASVQVYQPYNYGFSDELPAQITELLKQVVGDAAWLTPTFTGAFSTFAALAATWNRVTDIWGASKNTLLYVRDETLRVTANGYAVLMQKHQVQQAVADFAAQFSKMLADYQARKLWPINSPLEIRVTALDDPSKVATPSGSAASPVISGLSVDPVVQRAKWDVACWFDVLTIIPEGDPQRAYEFYEEFESWIYTHFADGFRVVPEWSKGWAYTADGGAWTNEAIIDAARRTFTDERPADDTWSWEQQTLANYDSAGLFLDSFLERLFGAVTADAAAVR